MENTRLVYLIARELVSRAFGDESQRINIEQLLAAWRRRESTFTFLESAELPDDHQESSTLCALIASAERLSDEICALQAARAAEGRAPLPEQVYQGVGTLEELTLMEELFDCDVLNVTNSIDSRSCLAGARALADELYRASSALLTRAAPIAPEQETQSGAPWILEMPLGPSPLRRAGEWREAWSEEGLGALLGRGRAEVNEREVYHRWSRELSARAAGELSWEEVWREHLAPAAPELALSALRADLESAVIEDVADEFERLASARRPKDQRVAGVVFWGDRWEQVTVMFAKRDGQLLAQRDITWDPTRPDLAVEAFSSIKIRTLVVPCELPSALLPALEALTARYDVARVSAAGVTPVTRPANLTLEAQRAWQLAQRFAAPLRFWARADISALARELLPSPLHAVALGTPEREGRMQARVRCRSDARWLELRRRRLERGAREAEREARPRQRPPEPPPQRDEELSQEVAAPPASAARPLRRGDEVEVQVTSVEPYRLRALRLEDSREALISLSGSRDGASSFRVGERIKAYVIHDHPRNHHLSLTLRPLRLTGRSPRGDQATPQERRAAEVEEESTTERESLSRLSSLFKPRR